MSKKCPIMKRIKDNYESRSKLKLVKRVPVIMRIDGKAFHTYTKNLNTPFDTGFIEDMNNTAIHLCSKIQGAKCAYIQSDEINILITDFKKLTSEAWFDYKIQKMTSISASFASSKFNQLRIKRFILDNYQSTKAFPNRVMACDGFSYTEIDNINLADFDSRVFNIPKEEVNNYFVARQRDAIKNSISSTAQSLYSSSQLDKVNQSEKQELIFQKGINWNNFPTGQKRGRFVIKVDFVNDVEIDQINYDVLFHSDINKYMLVDLKDNEVYDIIKKRTKWKTVICPEFSKTPTSINNLLIVENEK